jgi:murein DD-endopeptidase MepM/ murein hydrolase activator NlpD
MHLIITDAWLARSHAIHLTGKKLILFFAGAALIVMLLAALMYHWIFLKGAREGWPVVGTAVRWIVRDEFEQRDRLAKENLTVIAKRVGELQVQLSQIDELSERVSGLAGISSTGSGPKSSKRASAGGQGGFAVLGPALTAQELQTTLDQLEKLAQQRTDLFTVIESRLFEQRMQQLLIPTSPPLPGLQVGSGFGWRIDPFTGLSALHTGLDFQAAVGTSILAAAGGIVVTNTLHPAYGNMLEIDHGNGIVSRYAHASRLLVRTGDLVKRGQKIAEVGTTGRSTGPHLHFEVLVAGVPQDPQKFLDAGKKIPDRMAARGQRRRY